MALTIQNQILGQVVDNSKRYYYLYEPLPIIINESDNAAQTISIDINLIDSNDSITNIETLSEYAIYDLNPNNGLHIDLMRIIQQAHDARLFEFGTIDDILNDSKSILSKYIYELVISSDSDSSNNIVLKIVPIIGGRNFRNFSPLTSNFPINGYEKYNIDMSSRWKDYPFITTSFVDLSQSNINPINTKNINIEGKYPCGGMVIWKSRLSGWMYWGFDIKTQSIKSSYKGSLEVGMFELQRNVVGSNPFVESDYSELEFNNTISLKSLSLTRDELFAVSDISQSPAIYYMEKPDGKIELMRLTSASTPLSNQSNGGDFSLSLKSISKTNFKVR